MSGHQDHFVVRQGVGAGSAQASHVMVMPDMLEGGAPRRAPVQGYGAYGQCEFTGSGGRAEQGGRPALPEGDSAMDNESPVAQE